MREKTAGILTKWSKKIMFWNKVSILQKRINELENSIKNLQQGIDKKNLEEKTTYESEVWFNEIFNSTNEAIIIHDAVNGQIIDVNNYALNLYNYSSKDEMLQESIEGISFNEGLYSKEIAIEYWKKATEGIPQNFEWKAKRKNGEIFWVEVSLKSTKINGKERILATVRDINQRKNTEEALLESETFLKETQKIAQLGIYIMDIRTGIWSCSEILDTILGIDANYAKTVEGWAAIVHSDWQTTMVEYFVNEVMGKKQNFDKEYKITRIKDKADRWVHGLGKLEIDENGQVVKMIGTIRDITERKMAEEILRATEAKQSAMIANVSDVIAIINENAIVVYKSPNIEKWFGWQENDLNGNSTWNNIHSEDLPATKEIFNRLLAEKNTTYKGECRYQCKDGNYKWIEYTASNLLQDPHIKGILLNYHDITERKNIDKALHTEQMFSKAILDCLPGIFYLYSYPELKLLQWNKNHETLMGYSSEELQNFSIFNWHAPEAHEALKAVTESVMQTGQSSIEAPLIAKDGHLVPLLLTGVRFEMQDKLYMVGVGIDVSELKKKEQQLIEKSEEIKVQNEEFLQLNEELMQTNDELLIAKDHAEESDRLKTAFLQNMSHEIRTPMNAIMGFSELMVDEYNNKEKLEYFAQIINRRCNDLLAIINDILDIARIESGQLPVKLEKCKIGILYEEIESFFIEYKKRIKKENVQFILNISDDLKNTSILTDIVKLKQILINLISNAFKFTEQGKIECCCKITEQNNISFCVSDTGVGIPEDKYQFIFERFAQAHQDKKALYGGTGLGLSIVKGLVDLLKGKIWVESSLGHGSTFYFTIPYTKTPTNNLTDNKSIEQADVLNFNGQNILIVEDEMFNTVYLEEILSGKGLNLVTTMYGEEAIDIIKSQAIDIVLMDIRLPDITGYEAIHKILQISPNIKIIAQTAYAAPEDRQKAFEAGCIDYISKPVKKEQMLSLLKKYLLNT